MEQKQDKNKIQNQNLKSEKSFLERQLESFNINGIKDSLLPADRIQEDEESIKEQSEKLQQFKDEYDKQIDVCRDKAKNLLSKVASLYLTGEQISKTEYIKFRNDIEEMSLSSLIFQLSISQKAIYKIQESIHLGNTNSRLPEVLTGLIRVTLDTSKFLHEYLTSLQNTFKDLRDDLDGNESTTTAEISSTTTTVVIRDKKKLISDINKTITDLQVQKITATYKSPNSNITPKNGYAQNIPDAEIIQEQIDSGLNSGNSDPFKTF